VRFRVFVYFVYFVLKVFGCVSVLFKPLGECASIMIPVPSSFILNPRLRPKEAGPVVNFDEDLRKLFPRYGRDDEAPFGLGLGRHPDRGCHGTSW